MRSKQSAAVYKEDIDFMKNLIKYLITLTLVICGFFVSATEIDSIKQNDLK